MPSYGQRYCPIARASEVLTERWTPIIVRNLLLGCRTFTQILDGTPGISRSVLTQRLRDLERHGIVERAANPHGRGSLYALTEAGHDLQPVCDALGTWGARWLDVAPAGLDPGIVLWAVAKCMAKDALPDHRIVVRFDLRGYAKTFWLLVQQPEPELCRKHPGFEEDLVVRTDPETLARWHMGRTSLREATREGRMHFEGVPRVVRAFSRWGGQTPFANVRPVGSGGRRSS